MNITDWHWRVAAMIDAKSWVCKAAKRPTERAHHQSHHRIHLVQIDGSRRLAAAPDRAKASKPSGSDVRICVRNVVPSTRPS